MHPLRSSLVCVLVAIVAVAGLRIQPGVGLAQDGGDDDAREPTPVAAALGLSDEAEAGAPLEPRELSDGACVASDPVLDLALLGDDRIALVLQDGGLELRDATTCALLEHWSPAALTGSEHDDGTFTSAVAALPGHDALFVGHGEPWSSPRLVLLDAATRTRRAQVPDLLAIRAELSPDGALLAVTTPTELLVFATGALTELHRVALEAPGARALTFVPAADGPLVATAGPGGVQLVDPLTGARVRTLALAGLEQDTDDAGEPAWTDELTALAASADGTRLAAATRAGRIALFDLASGTELAATPPGEHAIWALAFSPDGTRLATAGRDPTLRLLDAAAGAGLAERAALTDHRFDVYRLVYAPDGTRLYSASADRTVGIWDPTTGARLVPLARHTAPAHALAFSPDGTHLASAGNDERAFVWDLAGTHPPTRLEGHTADLTAVAFSPDGMRVATASRDQSVRVWPREGGAALEVLRGHSGTVRGVAFLSDALLVSGGDDGTLRQWSLASSAAPASTVHGTAEAAIAALAIAPGRSRLALRRVGARLDAPDDADGASVLELYGVQSDGALRGAKKHARAPARRIALEAELPAMALAPGGDVVAVVAGAGEVQFLDAERGTALGTTLLEAAGDEAPDSPWPWEADIRALAFLDGGRVLAAVHGHTAVARVDLLTGEPLEAIELDLGALVGLAASPDGHSLAVSSASGRVVLLEPVAETP